MIQIDNIQTNQKTLQAIKTSIPNAPNLILIKGTKGIIMCGYLNPEVAEKINLPAAIVSGVSTIDDVLNAEIKYATTAATKLGITKGQTVKNILEKIA